jgi:hypothetical protein
VHPHTRASWPPPPSKIREWLGKTVGKEAEDLSRHDKWLCMMYPRLALLRQFLTQDGVILVRLSYATAGNEKYLGA